MSFPGKAEPSPGKGNPSQGYALGRHTTLSSKSLLLEQKEAVEGGDNLLKQDEKWEGNSALRVWLV